MDQQTFYRLFADLVLLLHAGFIAFVVLGQVLIVIGLAARWKWARGFRFRLAHLAAIVFVTLQTWAGFWCPLTMLENRLRAAAGQGGYDEGFIAYWLHELLFYEASKRTFAVAYSLFALVVVVTWIFGRPERRPR